MVQFKIGDTVMIKPHWVGCEYQDKIGTIIGVEIGPYIEYGKVHYTIRLNVITEQCNRETAWPKENLKIMNRKQKLERILNET